MDEWKKVLVYFVAAVILLCSGAWICSNIHDDRESIEPTIQYIQSAGREAKTAAGSLNEAGAAVDNTGKSAEKIKRGNQQLTEISGDITDLISNGKQIIADISRNREKDSTTD